jgi:hypothetical protein
VTIAKHALLADPNAMVRDDGITNLKGLATENWCCVDCGVDTAPGCLSRIELEIAYTINPNAEVPQRFGDDTEVYFVRDNVWKKAGMDGFDGCLCIGCLEKRIGRRLKPRDFDKDHPFNDLPGSERLMSRRGR